MYRKYCSDKVVIIEKRGKFQCVSKVGKLTGEADLATNVLLLPLLDSYFLTIIQQSSEQYFSTATGLEPSLAYARGILTRELFQADVWRGFICSRASRLEEMYLTRTSKSSKDVFVRSRPRMVCLRKKHTLLLHFDMDSSKDSRDAWVRWFDSYAPTNDNVYDYISSHPYRCPFSSFFESDTCYGRTDHWSKPVGAAVDEFSSIFPSATVVALPTVRTSHTPSTQSRRICLWMTVWPCSNRPSSADSISTLRPERGVF